MPPFSLIARRWLPLAALTTVACLLVYLEVQQSIRAAANDPQIQLAEDAVAALERGEPLDKVFDAAKVDMARSLTPFLIVYDESGKAIGGSGTLRGQSPAPPIGVFEFTRTNGEERVTWQPERGVRIASVVLRTTTKPAAWVLAGRNMREIERREAYAHNVAAGALAATLCITLLLVTIGESISSSSRV